MTKGEQKVLETVERALARALEQTAVFVDEGQPGVIRTRALDEIRREIVHARAMIRILKED